uniref:Emm64 protein n=2 Tax=Streptococcus pyogenes TaxID=1314 RepID=Q54843_STRPY|nr:emm64 [Streptococcus pyogenes]
MVRKDTNKQYSLRKLKTGTASVAVAVAVLGAGFANQTEVKADVVDSEIALELEANRADELRREAERLEDEATRVRELSDQLDNVRADIQSLIPKLSNQPDNLWEQYINLSRYYDRANITLEKSNWYRLQRELWQQFWKNRIKIEQDLSEQKKQLRYTSGRGYNSEIALRVSSLVNYSRKKTNKEVEMAELTIQISEKEAELDSIDELLSANQAEIDKLLAQLTDIQNAKEALTEILVAFKVKKYKEISELQQRLNSQERLYDSFLYQAIDILDSQLKKIVELALIDRLNRNLLGNSKDELNKLSGQNEQLSPKNAKLTEDKQILRASRQGLRRDLNASREAKKQVEKDLANLTAELDKVKEEKQISDASRQGLRRDLDASREAKKQVEKALEEANRKLAALEKLNKVLGESKKETQKEKAELQAKLEAEAKALKEQLAKQAEELAKLRAEKASDSQTPDAKPGNKAVPGKGQAPQAGTKPNQNKAPMKETKRQLPSTGEAANPFFTAAALTVMATAGVAAVVKRKEEN